MDVAGTKSERLVLSMELRLHYRNQQTSAPAKRKLWSARIELPFCSLRFHSQHFLSSGNVCCESPLSFMGNRCSNDALVT